ncbi:MULTISPECIES: phenylalanine 4-monooxygenase [Pandoraea]|uniref:Phenylalanine-4-hydroxylase n=1 Tax=Pandoraea pnomenusa TaxID=93220 RepID=A0A378YNM6_9BURK|nr:MULTISPECIES: phenylalanine 4-monooxygenase [Pandoraea]AHB07972.1 phenylalanine 4-monooxygenase [Pandoraea pnomenusa 3kgm]AHB75831.1 phenylalanine 4-monooxygenase [Pandoraea pnomenusa]AHN75850.1 phenylalanine 4-monooxygenase [Pandoraea pnomenusa]AIU27564.1 phenylalanine 4-monooxygenase [Pandoraea pnomenusa]ANC44698.1 phenylalanine 4-monooxygenase [Pandoraea pnomenusa]
MSLTAMLEEQFAAGLTTRPDFTIDQPVEQYGAVDHAVWQQLYERQTALLPGRVCDAFMDGIRALDMDARRVPEFERLNEKLMTATGWRVVAVPGLVPDDVFFDHLANRRFPATWWMRRPDQLDYLQEPDCFHDVFGHVPLLANPVFADFMQAYGKAGKVAQSLGALPLLARLYWYTVEFGLMRDGDGLRIYGAGIVSSRAETEFSLTSREPNRIGFSLERVLRTQYRIDTFQQTYFVIDDFAQLFEAMRADLPALFGAFAQTAAFEAGERRVDDTPILLPA